MMFLTPTWLNLKYVTILMMSFPCLLIMNFQAVTGKQITFGFDVKGKPAFYMVPSRQNTADPVRQIQFVIWMLERVVELMGPGVE